MYIKAITSVAAASVGLIPVVSSGEYALAAQLLVCAAAVLLATQATRRRAFVWMVPFSLVAVLFNPVSTAGTAAVIGWWLHAVVIAFFAAYVLKLAPHAAVQEVGNRRR